MIPRFDYAEAVRVVKNIYNDGSHPDSARGGLLVRRGATGHVVDIGVFLQDQIIYSVDFTDFGRVIGCRETELIAADAPWVDCRFEFRDKVRTVKTLSVNGEIVVECGQAGEILKVLRDMKPAVQYQVLFDNTRILQVPESTLTHC